MIERDSIKLGVIFSITSAAYGKITEVFAYGFNYHTMDAKGNCIKGQQYITKLAFLKKAKELWDK